MGFNWAFKELNILHFAAPTLAMNIYLNELGIILAINQPNAQTIVI